MMSRTMSAVLLFVKVLTVYCLSPSQAKVEADCDKNVDLSCLCRDSTHFQLLSWYKIKGQKRHFLISTGDGPVEKGISSQRVTFGEEGDSLHLPAVTPSDSGTYKCSITAKVGGQNKDCVVDLVVQACVTNTETITMTNVMLTTIPSAVNASQNGEELPLPVVWSSLSCLAVGLAKVLISCIGVWCVGTTSISQEDPSSKSHNSIHRFSN